MSDDSIDDDALALEAQRIADRMKRLPTFTIQEFADAIEKLPLKLEMESEPTTQAELIDALRCRVPGIIYQLTGRIPMWDVEDIDNKCRDVLDAAKSILATHRPGESFGILRPSADELARSIRVAGDRCEPRRSADWAFDDGVFIWKGREIREIRDTSYTLLKAVLCTERNRRPFRLSFTDAAEQVWGASRDNVTDGAIRTAASRLDSKLHSSSVPISISTVTAPGEGSFIVANFI